MILGAALGLLIALVTGLGTMAAMAEHRRLYFEPRDLWVGVYWNPMVDHRGRRVVVYVCPVPTVVLRLVIRRPGVPAGGTRPD